jgi:regulator of sirC expression with transglutaminase-like and TPR domain
MDGDPSLVAFRAEVSRPEADIDLGRAALAIARVEHGTVDTPRYLDRLAQLARGADRGGRPDDPLCRLHRLREHLFEDVGFRGNAEDYYDPRNSLFNDVLDRRLGIPITLSLVLIEVARRVGLRVEGIGLPGHFIAGVRLGGEQVLLDPFNGGAVLTTEACQDLVARAVGRPVELGPEHFAAVRPRQLLARMLANLKGAYWRLGRWQQVVRVIDHLLALDPGAGGEWRDRGVAWSRLGELGRGLADWERYLTEFPGAPDHRQVRDELTRVRRELARLN